VADTHAMAAQLRSSGLDWTLVRAPRVVSARSPTRPRAGRLVLGPWSSVTRTSAAAFMVRCLSDGSSIRQAPMICDRRVRGGSRGMVGAMPTQPPQRVPSSR
jgi:hypothetical protein